MLLSVLQDSLCCKEEALEVLGVRSVTWKTLKGVLRHVASSRSQEIIGKAPWGWEALHLTPPVGWWDCTVAAGGGGCLAK